MTIDKMFLIADDPIYMQMGKRFESGNGATIGQVAILFGILLVAIFSIYAFCKWRERTKADENKTPQALFRRLCKAHRVNWFDRQLLLAFAKKNELTHPANVFVHRELFHDREMEQMTATQQQRLHALEKRLYS